MTMTDNCLYKSFFDASCVQQQNYGSCEDFNLLKEKWLVVSENSDKHFASEVAFLSAFKLKLT